MDIDCRLSVPQTEFLRRDEDPLLIWQAGVGSGKTFICSLYLIKHMLEGHRMVAGCLTHSALMKTLFSQCFDLAWKFGLNPVINKQDKTLKVGTGITYGYSNEAPNDVLGLSNIYGLVLDEASRCCEAFYNNLSDRLRGEGLDAPHKRLITSPCTEPGSEWYAELKRKHPESIIRATLYSNPFVSLEYIKELEDRYGIGSPLYRQQVLGEDIASDYLNAIVRATDFVDKENSRFSYLTKPLYYGVDLAGSGRDLTASALINETGLLNIKTLHKIDTIAQKNMIIEDFEVDNIQGGALDAGGLGVGVYDNIKHNPRVNIEAVNFAQAPSKDMYLNIRSEMYCEAAQAIKDGFYIDTSANKELVEELRNTQVFVNEKNKLQIIAKEDIRKRIGRSPDRADALVLAIHAMLHPRTNSSAAAVGNKVLAALGYV